MQLFSTSINAGTFGNYSLNISTILYLVYYLPQSIHNTNRKNLRELSIYFHFALLIGALFDLIYAIGLHMPWQYILVSSIWLSYMLIQQFQLWQLHKNQRLFQLISFALLIVSIGGFLVFILQYDIKSFFISLGYISASCALLSIVPQIVRNFNLASARSISILYLLLHQLIRLCDNISAWTLHWPLPNIIGSGLGFCLGLILLFQWVYYSSSLGADICLKAS